MDETIISHGSGASAIVIVSFCNKQHPRLPKSGVIISSGNDMVMGATAQSQHMNDVIMLTTLNQMSEAKVDVRTIPYGLEPQTLYNRIIWRGAN